jgi:diguanylate cyclase (GGDEF)-like protein/PAS domain S-box-containing protein
MMAFAKAMRSPSLKEIRMKVKGLEKKAPLQVPILEAIQDPFIILSQKGEFIKVNPKGLEILGYSWQELQKMALIDVVVQEDHGNILHGCEEMGQGGEIHLKTLILSQQGERIPVELVGIPREGMFLITLRDLREQLKSEEGWARSKKELMEKIRERDEYARELQAMKDLYKEKLKEIDKMKEEALILSYTDDLTGMYNHRFFIHQLTMEVDRQKRYPSPLSLLMIDIDYFKNYNDTNGHLAGDKVLRAISLIIQHAVRQTDIVARYGGEEFCAILINTNQEGAIVIAERVRRNVAETNFPNEKVQPNEDLTVSIGVTTFSSKISTVTDLIREADNALYRAKRAGRNKVEV